MRACILTTAITLLAIGAANAEDWYIGAEYPNEVVTQTTDRVVDGDIYIVKSGRLNLTGATLTVLGDIWVLNQGALEVTGGTIRFVQAFSYQSGVAAADDATLRFADATIDGGGHSYSVALLGSSSTLFYRVTVENGFATWAFWDDAVLGMAECVNAGEFVPIGENTITISDSETVLFWMTLPDGSVVDVALPPPGEVDEWCIGPDSSWAEGIAYSATLTDCTGVWWGVMAQSGCDGTFRDSALRVVGSYFDHANEITIKGIANNQSFGDAAYAWGDVGLRFVNTSVQTWNYYCYGQTRLTLEGCLFGELLAEEDGEARVIGSLCDGTGGYIGAFGNGSLWLINSTNLSQTTSGQDAALIVWRSALLGPDIDATGNSVMALLNAEYFGDPVAHDSAVLFDGAVSPVEAAVGQRVALRGTARMLTGPTSPFIFEGYSLDFGEGDEPAEWFPIGAGDEMVREDLLAHWPTRGLTPGQYAVRVSIHHNAGDPVSIASPASLAPVPRADAVTPSRKPPQSLGRIPGRFRP
jgi:hypothetical protein